MFNVQQFRYGADNFAYLIYGSRQAVAIDGGAWQEILSFLKVNRLSLEWVTNTHSHYDHTAGNDHLLKAAGAKFHKPSDFADNQEIVIDGKTIRIYRTPGHTNDSICFHAGNFLISGDTLFNATIGNCFSGNLRNFYFSIKRLMTLPDETIIYAGHDYIRDSLAFARHLEPDNESIRSLSTAYSSRATLYTTLSEERKVNPYLRFNEEPIIRLLRENNLPYATEEERWNSLMSIE